MASIVYPFPSLSWSFSYKKWLIRFAGGYLLWLLAIAFGLIALKGNMQGFGNAHWWHETGSVYLVWGFLNYLIFFTLARLIIPTGLHTRRYWQMLLHTYLLILLVGVLKYVFASMHRFEYVLVSHFVNGDENKPVFFSFGRYLLKTAFTGTFVSVLAYGWGLTANWFKGEKLRKELESKKMEAELSFLRMQVNPHFLFNSLNSIYSLSLKKSDDTPAAVLKLSELMRYMLYEREDEQHRVDLVSEIDYVKNYIGLQQIRFRDGLHVEFLVEGEPAGQKIAPLLLVPFIENGFKHGVLSDVQHPFRIHLLLEGGRLILQVRNRKNLDNKDRSGGVGLNNVKKRLELLYPGCHQLTIRDSDEFYECDLVLFL